MKGFRLKGIKSFIDSEDIEIKPITIFVGENSSGKSSLLRFSSVLAQTFKEEVITPLLLFGKMIDYGNYDEVKNSKIKDENISFEINLGQLERREIKMASRIRYSAPEETQEYLTKELRVGIELSCERKIELKELNMYLDKEEILKITKIIGNKYRIVSSVDIKGMNIIKSECELHLYKFLPWRLDILEEVEMLKLYEKYYEILKEEHKTEESFVNYIYESRYIDSKNGYIYPELQNEYLRLERHLSILKILVEICRQKMINYSEDLSYIGPFRSKPERNYREYESTYNTVGVNGENTYQILKQNYDNEDKEVSKWLKEILGVELIIDEIEGSNLYKIMIKDELGTKANLIDTGYGISQILPILTELLSKEQNSFIRKRSIMTSNLYRRREGKTLIIEQPEIHLHPAAQSKLADLFLGFIKKGHNLILETHSEHLIKKFQILVAEDNGFSSNDIAIYYVHKDRGEGAKIERLLLDENGRFLQEWPTGFFDQGYKLASELLRTISNKKKITGNEIILKNNEGILKKKEILKKKILLKKIILGQERD